ncbi:MAG: iron-containing alcohol dehydrogenase [Gammaproteobacteria bacterium]
MTHFDYSIARLPEIRFGAGSLAEAPERAAGFGSRVLLVTGGRSFREGPHWQPLIDGLAERGLSWRRAPVLDEPSPELVDEAVAEHAPWSPDVVLGIGGGSVLDAAKAIAGLLPHGNSVMDHLEGVGRGIAYTGPATPFIAVPTTAGTGSEATKNAVLSVRGTEGFKKSFRHDELVPRLAIVDPGLLAGLPRPLMAAQGMDAFTQCLESYVSLRSNPMTDALAWSGMKAFKEGFFKALDGDPEGHARIAHGSLMSGICLAQTGLGSVHGLASPLGAFFPIPHGVVCGTLVAEATDINIRALRERAPDSPALEKYARVGALLAGTHFHGLEVGQGQLVKVLRAWQTRLELSPISTYGMTATDIPRVVANCRGGSMQTNPLTLTDAELGELLERRL